MANAARPSVEQRVVAFALGQLVCGPARIAAELAGASGGASCCRRKVSAHAACQRFTHTGRWTSGRTPEDVIGKAKLWS